MQFTTLSIRTPKPVHFTKPLEAPCHIHFSLSFFTRSVCVLLFMCFVLLWHSWFILLITSIPLLVDIHDNLVFFAEALTACSYDVCSVKILISIWINISSLIMVCEFTKPYTFKMLLSGTSMNSIKNEWKVYITRMKRKKRKKQRE